MVHENNFKYLAAPTIEQIESVVKAVGVSESQFERFHKMYKGAIKFHRMGFRTMPSKHWSLFYEPNQKLGNKFSNHTTPEKHIQRTKPKKSGRISGLLD